MGLLDGILGNGFEDPRSQAIMALAGGLLSANGSQGLGAGLLGANQAVAQAQDRAQKQRLLEAQLANYASEAEARKLATVKDQRQQALIESMFGGAPGQSASAGASPVGSVGAPGGMSSTPTAAAGGNLVERARSMGIPDDAIKADLVFNGGKKISEMLAEHGAPKWQNINGNLVNTNAPGFQGGLQAGVSAGSGGQVTAWMPDGKGGLVVGAPSGALDTFNAYQRTGEGAKADFDLQTVTPQGQNPQLTTRGALVRAPQVGGTQIQPGQQAQMDQGRADILNQELTKAQAQLKAALQSGDAVAANRAATDVSSLNRELGRAGGASRATVGMPLQSDAEKANATDLAKGAAERENLNAQKGAQFKDFRDQLNIARTLLGTKPTESTVGAAADAVANVFGATLPGAAAAKQLDLVGGWMTQNIPKAPGAQSNYELMLYKDSAAQVGDKTLPVKQRLAALSTLEQVINTWEKRRETGATVNPGAAAPQPAASNSGGWSAVLKN